MAEMHLEECLAQAWSYENRDAHGSTGDTQCLGAVLRGDRLYDVHRDDSGAYFYTVRIVIENGIKPEYEAIFGHREPVGHRKAV